MDNQLEEGKNQIEKDIILNNIKSISQFIKSSNEESIYYSLFNENLFQSHNNWLNNVKLKIKKGIDNSEPNINISDIDYDSKILSLIKKIAEPHNYRNANEYNENNNSNLNENINTEIFDKINKLTNFNDIIGAVNSCSKKKRQSLLRTIHKKNNSNEKNNINFEYNNDIKEYLEDDDIINMKEYDLSDQKEKITNDNNYPFDKNEEEIQNSLDTIVEQPSNEEFEKNTISQKSANIFSFSNNQVNKILNTQSKENNNYNKNSYILDFNNNINNNSNMAKTKKYSPTTDNKKNYKPLKIIESIITPIKINDYSFSQNLVNNNNYFLSNTNYKPSHENLFKSQENSPYFKIKDCNENSSNKNNTPMSNFSMKNDNQFSFKNSNQKIINFNNDFTFSTIKKKNINISNNKNNILNSNIPYNNDLSPNKDSVIIIHTGKKNNLSKEKNNNSNNPNNPNNNFINIITNSINNIHSESNQIIQNIKNNQNIQNSNKKNINIKFHNVNNIIDNKKINPDSLNVFNSNNNDNNKEININNKVHTIVLTSTKNKKINENQNEKKKEKYVDDFEEYEISDSSIISNDGYDYDKFIPKWAMDEEYINEQIKKQENNKDLIVKSFGNFVVENLNLNMIFETHNEELDIRHSTADWRGDDSFGKNKVTNFTDKEKEDLFPNRKLKF